MKKTVFTGLLLTLSMGGYAYADDDDCYVPMSKWQSREAVRSMARDQGWEVRRLKIDDGCYQIKGYDASGREIEAKIDPATLQVVDFEYEGDDDDDDHKKKKKRRDKDNEYRNNGNNAAPMAPATPPDNGLFAPDNQPKVIVK